LTSAQTVTITATASDNVGVTNVEFYDGTTLKYVTNISPYTYQCSVTSQDNGTHPWTAKAYDAANNSTVSSPVNLTVDISVDTTPPTIAISGPSSVGKGSATFAATAADNIGVVKVQFYLDNVLVTTDTLSPYT